MFGPDEMGSDMNSHVNKFVEVAGAFKTAGEESARPAVEKAAAMLPYDMTWRSVERARPDQIRAGCQANSTLQGWLAPRPLLLEECHDCDCNDAGDGNSR